MIARVSILVETPIGDSQACPSEEPKLHASVIEPFNRRKRMSDSGSGASGVLGVVVGAMLVVFVGAAVLMATGKLGDSGPRFTISVPGAR